MMRAIALHWQVKFCWSTQAFHSVGCRADLILLGTYELPWMEAAVTLFLLAGITGLTK